MQSRANLFYNALPSTFGLGMLAQVYTLERYQKMRFGLGLGTDLGQPKPNQGDTGEKTALFGANQNILKFDRDDLPFHSHSGSLN